MPKKKWEQGMKEEMDSLENNQTWYLVQLPMGKRALQNKWVYKLKEEDGGEKRYKARLVVKGFAQKKGIDFDEIFSPVVLTGENERSPTGRVDPVRGCLNNPSRLG
jgi:hypothetical protein